MSRVMTALRVGKSLATLVGEGPSIDESRYQILGTDRRIERHHVACLQHQSLCESLDLSHVSGHRHRAVDTPQDLVGLEVLHLATPLDGSDKVLGQWATKDDVELAVVHQHLVVVQQRRHLGCHTAHPVVDQILLDCTVEIKVRHCSDVDRCTCRVQVQVRLIGVWWVRGCEVLRAQQARSVDKLVQVGALTYIHV
jgi:hypothetical protein